MASNPRARAYTRRPRVKDLPDIDALMNGTSNEKTVSRETPAAPSIEPPPRPDPRGEMRPDPRATEAPHEMTSRERAERRTLEIMGHLDENLDEGVDELSVEKSMVPDGWTYEWKRQSVYGKSDPAYDSKLARTGWEPVPAHRHPSMMPKGHRGEITRDGLVLMERPEAITKRVKDIMYRKAKGAVALKEQQLNESPDGTFARVDERGHPTARVKTSYSPVDIAIPVPDQ